MNVKILLLQAAGKNQGLSNASSLISDQPLKIQPWNTQAFHFEVDSIVYQSCSWPLHQLSCKEFLLCSCHVDIWLVWCCRSSATVTCLRRWWLMCDDLIQNFIATPCPRQWIFLFVFSFYKVLSLTAWPFLKYPTYFGCIPVNWANT